MFIKHSDSLKSPNPIDLRIGELAINFRNKHIYTKTLTSKVSIVGNSLRKLVEFSDFRFDRVSTNSNFAFLRVLIEEKGNARRLYLTTSLPFLYLNALNGIQFTDPLDNTYLGYDSDVSKLKNIAAPEFNVGDLTDVNLPALDADYHNFALTSIAGEYDPTKDILASRNGHWWARWILRPEATRVSTLDDVTGTPAPYKILRRRRSNETSGGVVYIEPLLIVGDSKPTLGGDLNASGYAIVNELYGTQLLNLTEASDSASLDVTLNNAFTIKCNNTVYYLSIDVSSSFNEANAEYGKFKPFSIFIQDFTGVLNFTNTIQFENGIPPILEGKNHILTGYLVYPAQSTTPTIYLFQKATNLAKVT